MADVAGRKSQLHGWERVVLVLFGGFLAGNDLRPTALTTTLQVVGWVVILATVGVVEILMAVYYRTKQMRARS
jgi:hypothetical protein